MTQEELARDVAFARALAEEGRQTPLLSGAHLLFWGVLNAIAFSVHWSILVGDGNGGGSFGALWLGYGLAAAAGMAILRFRLRNKPGLGSLGVRADRSIWNGASIALAAVVVGSLTRLILDQDVTAPNAILGAAFAIYGAALFGVARLSGQGWVGGFGLLSAAIAAILCAFANETWVYLAAAAGAALVLAVPGAILLRREPSAVA